MKNRLLNGEMIDLLNDSDSVSIWFQEKTQNFCLMLNSKVVKSTRTWKPIQIKLQDIGDLKEVDQ